MPENLNFLPTIPVDSIYGKKLRYETGNIKLYSTDENAFNGFVLAVDEYQKYNKYSYCRIIFKFD